MVANNKTVGKLEKSSGLKVCKATIKINKDNNILLVKKRSKDKTATVLPSWQSKLKIPKGKAKILVY